MADKYVDVSLTTGANDGSSPANAWQSLSDVLDGSPTNGTLAAGDVVHIRTAANGANLTEDQSAVITTPTLSGAENNPVIWKFDDGTVWSGDTGQFIFVKTSANDWTIKAGNIIDGDGHNYRLILRNDYNGADDNVLIVYAGAEIHGVKFLRGDGLSSARDLYLYLQRDTSLPFNTFLFKSCLFHLYTNEAKTERATSNVRLFKYSTTASVQTLFLDCDIAFSEQNNDQFLFGANELRTTKNVFVGCRFLDTNNTHKIVNSFGDQYYGVEVVLDTCDMGFINPQAHLETINTGWGRITAEKINGTFDFWEVTKTGFVKWEEGKNYPYLNATLPNGNGWSIMAYPYSTTSAALPMQIYLSDKLYNQADAVKTITAELLIKDTAAFSSPQKNEWWIEVTYTNSNGSIKTVSSKANGALDTSQAVWSSTSYGPNSYSKYKMSVTTPTAIKQNTLVRVAMYSTKPAINPPDGLDGDFYFVDPDVSIT